jgi:hypothetical protein
MSVDSIVVIRDDRLPTNEPVGQVGQHCPGDPGAHEFPGVAVRD